MGILPRQDQLNKPKNLNTTKNKVQSQHQDALWFDEDHLYPQEKNP